MRVLGTPELIRRTVEGALLDVHTSFAGEVVSFDSATWRATVRPAVRLQGVDSDSPPEVDELEDITDVPVLYPRGGGFAIYWPLQPGDPVRLEFSEEDDAAFYGGSEAVPLTPQILRRFGAHVVARPEGLRGDAPALSGDAMLVGLEDGAQVKLEPDLISLAGGAQFVALANLVKDEISALRSWASSHIHTTTATIGLGGPGVISPPSNGSPPPVNDVAAEKVKAT